MGSTNNIRSRTSIASSRISTNSNNNTSNSLSIASGDGSGTVQDSSAAMRRNMDTNGKGPKERRKAKRYNWAKTTTNTILPVQIPMMIRRFQWKIYRFFKRRNITVNHTGVLYGVVLVVILLALVLMAMVLQGGHSGDDSGGGGVLVHSRSVTMAAKRRHHGNIVKRTVLVERPSPGMDDPPIMLGLFDVSNGSIGGTNRMKSSRFHSMPETLVSSPEPDYGDLQINFLDHGERRLVHRDPNDLHGHVWSEEEYEDESWDEYYSFDDDYRRGLPFEGIKKKCRRVAFHRNYFPNCNVFHEIEIMKGTNRYLGSGAYREAYLQHETYDPQLVVKVQRFHKNPFTYDRYEFIRMDALVMERLTASPRIADIYGHCATSVYSEFLPDEAEERIIPGDGDGSDLHDKDDVDPKNNFTISEKLDMALQMAESIADLHGYKYGVIVHDDIQLAQFLFAPDGRLKLNDFNRAEAMLFDEEDGSYCRYQNGKGAGDYRAPEEYKDGWLNEKIDVFSFGNNIYALITGLWVFYGEEKTKDTQKKLVDGQLAYLDPRYKGRNYIQDCLIELMYRCWVYEPDDRVDIFEAVSFLRETLKEAKRRHIYDGRF